MSLNSENREKDELVKELLAQILSEMRLQNERTIMGLNRIDNRVNDWISRVERNTKAGCLAEKVEGSLGRRHSSTRRSSKSSKSAGDSVSESLSQVHAFTREASEASHHTERESEETLGYEEDDCEADKEGSETDSEMEEEGSESSDEGSEPSEASEDDKHDEDEGDEDEDEGDEPSEDKTDEHESSDELSEYEADTYEGSDEPSEYESDEDCGLDEGDVDVDEGYEPSGFTRYEAGGVPAEANEGSDEPSPASSGLPGRSPDTRSCTEQLGKGMSWRSSLGAPMPWTRGAKLLCDMVLPAFGSVTRRHLRMTMGHRTGVG
jgi:hypothetical protein